MTKRSSRALIVAIAVLGAACATASESGVDSGGAGETTTTRQAGAAEVALSTSTTATTIASETTEAVTETTGATDTTTPPGPEAAETTTTVQRADDLPSAQPIPPADTVPRVVGEVPPALMDNVYSLAEAKTGADRSSMVVLRAEAVTWSDGSLGCPEPGATYTQALVDGYWVELASGDTTLDFRLGNNGAITLCESGGVMPIPGNDG